MDAQLAALYGTNQSETEKVAEAQVEETIEYLTKVADANDIDLDQLSDEQLAEFASEVLGNTEEQPNEMQEKVAEADFLGRVMAHAYSQELGEIEKQARPQEETVEGKAKNVLQQHLDTAKAAIKARDLNPLTKSYYTKAHEHLGKAVRSAAKGGAEGIGARAAHLGKGLARYAPHAAAATGVALAARKLMQKKSSADLDKLAEDRAAQMLLEQGWIDEEGNLLHDPSQVKEAGMTPEQAVEVRALQILEENGFPVTWNE